MINPGKAQEQQWETEKQACLIRWYVKNPHQGKAKLKKMDSGIKRDKNGKVAKKDLEKFQEMEWFRGELNKYRLGIR